MTDQQEARRALRERLIRAAETDQRLSESDLRAASAALSSMSQIGENDTAMMSVAMHEWARLIRLAEDQQTLLDIADDIDLNAAALSSPSVSGGWQGIETNPKDGAAFRAYAPELVHADFNPGGSVEACFDGERFVGAVWDGCFDAWNTVAITPTHWMPLPEAPKGPYHV